MEDNMLVNYRYSWDMSLPEESMYAIAEKEKLEDILQEYAIINRNCNALLYMMRKCKCNNSKWQSLNSEFDVLSKRADYLNAILSSGDILSYKKDNISE
jgi:hypothetical protein